MSLLHFLFGKPTQKEWARVKVVKSRKTWKVNRASISLDAAEVLESEGYKNAICQVRNLEADNLWGC